MLLFCVLATRRSSMNPTPLVYSADPGLWQNDSSPFNTTPVYEPVISAGLNKTINLVLIVAVTITMVSLGCSMELSKIKVTSR